MSRFFGIGIVLLLVGAIVFVTVSPVVDLDPTDLRASHAAKMLASGHTLAGHAAALLPELTFAGLLSMARQEAQIQTDIIDFGCARLC